MTQGPKWQYDQNKADSKVYSAMIITEREPLLIENTYIQEMYFIEDIFKQCIVGKISFLDRGGLQEFASFSGAEKIAIIYSVGESNRTLLFDIWKVGKIQQAASSKREQEQLMEILFVDPFYTPYILTRYSRSFSGKISETVRYILDKMMWYEDSGVSYTIEETSNDMNFVMPYWTPRQALGYLGKRSRGIDTGEGGYLCYNNTANEKKGLRVNFVSLNYLFGDVARTLDPQQYRMADKDSANRNVILEWWMTGMDKTSNVRLKGGTWKGYDFTRKKLLDEELQYKDAMEKTVILGKQSLFGPISDPTSFIMVAGEDNEDSLANYAYAEWIKRYSMQQVVNIIVQGSEHRFAGQMIQIEWPSRLKEQGFNESLQGKYLIKSVTHTFGSGKEYPYTQRLVLLKNGYHSMETEWLLPSKRINITKSEKTPIIITR